MDLHGTAYHLHNELNVFCLTKAYDLKIYLLHVNVEGFFIKMCAASFSMALSVQSIGVELRVNYDVFCVFSREKCVRVLFQGPFRLS